MSERFFLGLSLGVRTAFRTLIPEPQNRIPISWTTTSYTLVAYLPFLFMAYLVRRPETHLIRILLLPTVICAIFGTAYRFVWPIPETNVYNWGQCLLAEVYVAKALEFAFVKRGRFKIGEIPPGESNLSNNIPSKAMVKDRKLARQPSESPFLPRWLYDALEVSFSLRGIGWDFGRGTHIPLETRSLERRLFLRATLFSLIRHFLLLDFLESLVKLLPGAGTPQGGTIFYASLPPLQRYTLSTIVHVISGTAMLSGFYMIYDSITFFSVGLLNSSPAAWPPVMDNPWISDSMHVFWSKRWHQFLRRTFLVYGGYAGRWLLGEYGMVQGVFLASGLYHECGIYAMGRGWDNRVVIYFAMQAPILACEKLWRKMTGRRVGGWVGMLWVYFNMFFLAQPAMDAWYIRGLGGALVIPPFVSPARQFLVPLLQGILHQQFPHAKLTT